MNLVNLLALLIISSGTQGGSFSENLSFATEGNPESEVTNTSFTPDITDSSEVSQFEDGDYDSSTKVEFDFSPGSEFPEELNDSSSLDEPATKKSVLNLFKDKPSDFGSDYHDEESRPNQNLTRRQVNNLDMSEEPYEANNVLWSLDLPETDLSRVQNEYADEMYPFDPNQKNGSSADDFEDNYQVESPRYYQKNYYYNYYPLVRGRYDKAKYNSQKFGNDDEILDSEASTTNEKFQEKKSYRKNPCKMYLQFLKYAFKELDKNSEYYEDLTEEYFDDWKPEANRRVFTTQLLGPTLYIDNSGRVFQVNSKGNSIQTVEGLPPPSKVLPSDRNFIKLDSTTLNYPNDYKTQTASTQPSYNPYIFTYRHPSVEITRNTESYDEFEKDYPTTITEKDRKKEYTYPTTIPTFVETTFTDPFLTTTPSPQSIDGKYHGRTELGSLRPPHNETSIKTNSSVGSPLFLQRPSPKTSSESNFRSKTKISFGRPDEQENKDPDCHDKMLPCPDTFNITYPLNGYCNRYVSCESGVAIRRTCANGFHFNIITKSCDFPHNSICSYYCPEPNGVFGIPGDCGGYFVCENSVPEYRMCPPRMHWDSKISSCTFAALSTCPMKCLTLNDIRPYTGDCKAYIICLNGIPYYHKCPPNLIYNSESQTCVPEKQFYCKNDPKLITKTSNPSNLCNSVDQKLGTKAWCSYNFPSDSGKIEEKSTEV